MTGSAVRCIAFEYGLSTQIDVPGPARGVIEQDLDFLRARREAFGAYCRIDTRVPLLPIMPVSRARRGRPERRTLPATDQDPVIALVGILAKNGR